jgi:aquaporin Z
MAFAIGHISGCHLNPAVSVGLAVGGRFPMSELVPYVVAQVLGATVAAFLLYFIASGQAGFTLAANSLAVNGFGDLSPGKYSMLAGLVTEVVMTAVFLFVIMGSTDKRGIGSHAGLAIGLCLTLIHLISIPVTNTSVNPARSTGPAIALLMGGHVQALGQLWLFWLAPIVGAVLGARIYGFIGSNDN